MNNHALTTNDSLIADRYRILQKIGEGGMATVYRVEQIFLHEIFALKVLTTGQSDVSSVRFQKEAQVCRLLEHPNLIRVVDFAVLDNGSPYLVMEFINGETLTQRLSAQGALTEVEAIDIFIQVMNGLEYAHASGVVHRDLKPSNIMLTRDAQRNPQVKILDFGIAKMTNKNSINVMDLTRTGEIFGSPLYMSPEQCQGRPVDLRSDLYSAGCALYQTLTGAPPFTGENAMTTLMLHQQDKPLPLKDASLGGQFSPGIEKLVLKLLAKDPDARYQSAADVREDLLAIKSRRRTSQIASPEKQSKKAKPQNSDGETSKRSISRNEITLSIICVLLTAALAAVLLIKKNEVSSATAPSPVTPVTASAIESEFYAPVPMQEVKNGPWQFIFPEQGVGKIAPVEADENTENAADHAIPASGKFQLRDARPFFLEAYMDKGFESADFAKFRGDEIKQLRLIDWRVSDETLAAIKHFKALDRLELFKCSSLTDKCLPSIAALPNLKTLVVTQANLHGFKLDEDISAINTVSFGKMVAQSHIKSLMLRNILQSDALAKTLVRSADLESLALDHAGDLTAAGLADIAKIKSLTSLTITEAPKLSDDAIKVLTSMENLHYLSLHNCNLTPASLKTFDKIPKDCFLVVDKRSWSPEVLESLVASHPGHLLLWNKYLVGQPFNQ